MHVPFVYFFLFIIGKETTREKKTTIYKMKMTVDRITSCMWQTTKTYTDLQLLTLRRDWRHQENHCSNVHINFAFFE